MADENTTPLGESSGRRSIITAIAVLLALALIGGGYYYFFFKRGPSLAEEQVNPPPPPLGGNTNNPPVAAVIPPPVAGSVQPAPAISIDSWLRYRNDQYGFEVKYPGEWMVEPSFTEFSKYVYLNPAGADQTAGRPAVAVEIYPEQKTLAEVLSNFDYLGGVTRDITIDGVAAKQITVADAEAGEVVVLVVAKNSMGFSVTASGGGLSAPSGVAKRIVSTFTFFK